MGNHNTFGVITTPIKQTEWLRARLYWRPLFESPRLDISVILNFQKNSITEMQRRQLFDKVRFLDCLLSNMVQYWFESNFFYIFYLSRISTRDCEDLADDSSEAAQAATQRPFRDSAKMSCVREGHAQLKVWQINPFLSWVWSPEVFRENRPENECSYAARGQTLQRVSTCRKAKKDHAPLWKRGTSSAIDSFWTVTWVSGWDEAAYSL